MYFCVKMAAGNRETLAGRMSALGKQHVQRSVGSHCYHNLTQLPCDVTEKCKGKVVPVLN
jgi:hypothetical protein